MKRGTKICIVAVLLIAVAGACFLGYKITGYRNAVNGDVAMHGTYETDAVSSTESAYLSINEDGMTYVHCTNGNDILQSGKLSKNTEGYIKLFKGDTEAAYGVIIPSYKKVYFVDTEMNMTPYFYKGKILRVPQ